VIAFLSNRTLRLHPGYYFFVWFLLYINTTRTTRIVSDLSPIIFPIGYGPRILKTVFSPPYLLKSMSTSMKLGDDLMKVPLLNVAGTNWVVYKDQFIWAIDAQGLLEHVDSSEREPTRPTLKGKKAGGSSKKGETAEEGFEVVEELTTEDEKKLEVWKKEL